jgi:hypothetical protein
MEAVAGGGRDGYYNSGGYRVLDGTLRDNSLNCVAASIGTGVSLFAEPFSLGVSTIALIASGTVMVHECTEAGYQATTKVLTAIQQHNLDVTVQEAAKANPHLF